MWVKLTVLYKELHRNRIYMYTFNQTERSVYCIVVYHN